MELIYKAFGWIMEKCYALVEAIGGFGGYALALLLFTVVCQIILFPFGIKQQKNSLKQASLRPKENVIRRRYNGRTDRASQMKMNEEIQTLYQEEHFSPFAGCLPLLIQLPLIFALFAVISEPLTYITGIDINDITRAANYLFNNGIDIVVGTQNQNFQIDVVRELNANPTLLADLREMGIIAKDALVPNFTIWGLDLSRAPSFYNLISVPMLIPVFTFLSSYFGQKLTRKYTYQAPSAESGSSMKLMNVMMPLLSAYFSYIWFAAMGIYWIFRSILSFLQQIILSKMYPIPKLSDEEMKAEEKAYMAKLRGKNTNKSAPVTDVPGRKSLIFDDDDDDTPAVKNEHSIVEDDSDK